MQFNFCSIFNRGTLLPDRGKCKPVGCVVGASVGSGSITGVGSGCGTLDSKAVR